MCAGWTVNCASASARSPTGCQAPAVPEVPEVRVGPKPGAVGAPEFRLPASRAMFEPADVSGFYYIVWRRDGSEWARSPRAPRDVEMPTSALTHPAVQAERTRGLLREVYTFTPPGECLLAGRSSEREQAALREYARWLAAISGGVLVFGLAVGWWIAARAIRPFGVIAAAARRIAAGELGERIASGRPKANSDVFPRR